MGRVHEQAIHFIKNRGRQLHTIVDGGANVGNVSELFISLCPEAVVHAFEPDPRTFVQLERRMTPHGRRVVCNNLALGPSPGRMKLHLGSPPATSSIYKVSREWLALYPQVEPDAKTIDVDTVTLDDYARKASIDRIDLLKLDTQGAELSILAGAEDLLGEKRIDFLLVEVFFVPFYERCPLAGDIMMMLAELEYFPARFWVAPVCATADRWERHADVLFSPRSKPPAR